MEQKVQMITSFFIRTIGPILLRGAVGGAGGTTNTDSRNKATDDDDFDDFASSEETGTKSTNVKISLPTFAPDSAEDENEDDDKNALSLPKSATNIRSSEPARINLLDSSFDNDKSPSSTLSAPSYSPTQAQDDFDSVR